MDNFLAYLLMAAITLPLSFFLARGCLRGVVRLMSGASGAARRDML
jgi:hypothetical protein